MPPKDVLNTNLNKVWDLITQKKFKNAEQEINKISVPTSAFDKRSYLTAKGTIAEALNHWEEATTIRREIVKLYPKEINPVITLARCYQNQKKFSEVKATLQAFIKINQLAVNNEAIQMAFAYMYLEQKKNEKAIAWFNKAHSKNKRNKLGEARAYQNLQQYDLAERCLKEIPQQNDEQVILAYACLYSLMGPSKKEEVKKKFAQLAHLKNNPKILICQGRFYCEIDEYDEAEKYIKSVPDWQSNHKCIIALARILTKKGLFTEAIHLYQTIKHWDQDRKAVAGIAYCYDAQGEMNRAILIIENLPAEKRSVEIYLTLAHCYKKIDETKKAEECFTLIKPSQFNRKVRISQASVFVSANKIQQAIDIYKQVLKDGYDKSVLIGLANCYFIQKNYREGNTTIEKIHHWQSDADALWCLTQFATELHQEEKLIGFITKIKNWEKDPKFLSLFVKLKLALKCPNEVISLILKRANWQNDKNDLINLAAAYACQNNVVKEAEILQILQQKWPQDRLSCLDYARALMRLGNHEEAKSLLESVIGWREDCHIRVVHAYCLIHLERKEEAQRECHLIMKQWPSTESSLCLAYFYEKTSQFDLAIKTIMKIPQWAESKKTLIALGHCYRKMKNHEEAISYFKKIPHWQNDAEVINVIALTYIENKAYDLAEKIFLSYSEWKTDPLILVGLIRLYADMNHQDVQKMINIAVKQFPQHKEITHTIALYYQKTNQHEAINILENFTAKDTKMIQSLGILYREQGLFAESNTCFNQIAHSTDKSVLISRAIVLAEQGYLQPAIDLLVMHPAADNDIDILISMARIYQQMRQSIEAVNCIKKIKDWKRNRLALLTLGQIHVNDGKYNEAIATYLSISDWEKDLEVRLSISFAYMEGGLYKKAIENLNGFNVQDVRCVSVIAECHRRQMMFNEAEQVITLFPSWEKYKNLWISKIITEEIKAIHNKNFIDLTEAENYLRNNHPAWENDRDFLLTLARAYEYGRSAEQSRYYFNKLIQLYPSYYTAHISYAVFLTSDSGKYAEIITILQNMLIQFPDRFEAYLVYARFLINNGHYTEAEEFIAQSRKTFPYLYKLMIYSSDVQFLLGKTDEAEETLKSAIEQYPLVIHLYLMMIRFYIAQDKFTEAKNFYQDALKIFKKNELFVRKAELLFKNTNLIRILGMEAADDPYLTQTNTTVDVPPSIKKVFISLRDKKDDTGHCYLVGSAVPYLLGEKNMPPDLDFFVCDLSKEFLLQSNFIENRHIDNLFTKKGQGDEWSLDVISAKFYASEKSIKLNAYDRDFTFTALYCDEEGNIYDPLGRGLFDLKNKILRTIGPADVCLAKDPVRILRAINYIAYEHFQPTEELDKAIYDWNQKISPEQYAHLRCVLHKHLQPKDIDRGLYIQLLIKYGLVEKLFHIELDKAAAPEINVYTVLAQFNIFEQNYKQKEANSSIIQHEKIMEVTHTANSFFSPAPRAQQKAFTDVEVKKMTRNIFDQALKKTPRTLINLKELEEAKELIKKFLGSEEDKDNYSVMKPELVKAVKKSCYQKSLFVSFFTGSYGFRLDNSQDALNMEKLKIIREECCSKEHSKTCS